jgi:hypothetical protein
MPGPVLEHPALTRAMTTPTPAMTDDRLIRRTRRAHLSLGRPRPMRSSVEFGRSMLVMRSIDHDLRWRLAVARCATPGRPDRQGVGGVPYRVSGDHLGRNAREEHRSVLVKTAFRVPCSPSLSQCREVWAEWRIAR